MDKVQDSDIKENTFSHFSCSSSSISPITLDGNLQAQRDESEVAGLTCKTAPLLLHILYFSPITPSPVFSKPKAVNNAYVHEEGWGWGGTCRRGLVGKTYSFPMINSGTRTSILTSAWTLISLIRRLKGTGGGRREQIMCNKKPLFLGATEERERGAAN